MSAESNTSSPQPAGRTKWRLFAYAAVPAIAIAGTLIGLTAKGAIASSISVSGQQYLVTAKQLQGQGFVQFGGQVSSDQGGKQVTEPTINSGIAHATLKGLCQAVKVGPLTMRLTAGNGSEPVKATNMVVAASGQTGSVAVFHNISVGTDASALTKDGTETGAVGGFGQQADSVTIDNLRQNTWLTTAGTFTLPGLSLGFGGSC
jgi:hypothetical protein